MAGGVEASGESTGELSGDLGSALPLSSSLAHFVQEMPIGFSSFHREHTLKERGALVQLIGAFTEIWLREYRGSHRGRRSCAPGEFRSLRSWEKATWQKPFLTFVWTSPSPLSQRGQRCRPPKCLPRQGILGCEGALECTGNGGDRGHCFWENWTCGPRHQEPRRVALSSMGRS